MDPILDRMQAVFRDILDDETLILTPNLTAGDVDNWDSLSHISLIFAIEKEFQIKLTTAEISNLKTAGELEALVRRKSASPA